MKRASRVFWWAAALLLSAVRRTYLRGGARSDLLNLAPVDVQTATSMVGDLAKVNGKLRGDGVPCLVYYNGKSWVPCGAPAPK